MKMRERNSLNKLIAGAGITSTLAFPALANVNEKTESQASKPLNVLFITADDLNYNSTGYRGSKVDDITPNLDKLASQGIIFENAHVNCAVSQPSRGVLATGMYAHRNGVEGFYHTNKDVPTVMSLLREHGYRVGIAGKVEHSTPVGDFVWDMAVEQPELGQGRDPKRYYEVFKTFVKQSKKAKKPFYFMLNSHDPHRPFHGAPDDKKMREEGIPYPNPSKVYSPEEIEVPGFLPDIPAVREELAQYFSSIRRLDDTVGEVLKVLEEEKLLDNTIVMFLSDNGISAPFAKTNCYLNSTRTPWIVRWPNVVAPETRNTDEFIAGIDFLPTVLDACGIVAPGNVDGRSFLPLLKGERQTGREKVYTQFYETSALNRYPMFAVQDQKFGYIYNAWSDGKYQFRNDSQAGIAFKGMAEAGKTDPDMQKRVDLLWYRVPEEFYDLENDPDAQHNLVHDPAYTEQVKQYRQDLLKWMQEYGSSAQNAFEKLIEYSDARQEYMEEQVGKTLERRKQRQRR